MSIFGKNSNYKDIDLESEFKYTVSKTFLSDDEMRAFICAVVESVIDNEVDIPYYGIKNQQINQFTMAMYLDEESKKRVETEENIYNVINDIRMQIDISQYLDMIDSVNDGIKHELHKKSANFGLGDLGNPEEMMVQLQGLMEQIQTDPTVKKVVDLGIQDKATKMAQKEVQKEQKAKKAKQKAEKLVNIESI